MNKGRNTEAINAALRNTALAKLVYSASSLGSISFNLNIPNISTDPAIASDINNNIKNLISTADENKLREALRAFDVSVNIEFVKAALKSHNEMKRNIEPNNPELISTCLKS
ncbi:MAG: hypothetical protein Kow0098_12530 [Ignavibacteriaceae bacterium]